jgi:ubiquinone/menaquinone biosynthesis C-methylase UbiE
MQDSSFSLAARSAHAGGTAWSPDLSKSENGSSRSNPVVETYSKLADVYDDPANLDSCWGHIAGHSLSLISVRDTHRTVVDVGCGTGRELMKLASTHPHVQFVGVEPADRMRNLAAHRAAEHSNVRILEGRFESLPLETDSVDYLYSILAFHWTTDLQKSVDELARVLHPSGEMDLTFIGRHNGREFIRKTTPVFLRYMKLGKMVEAAALRKQLPVDEATALFQRAFGSAGLTVSESYHTYHDTLEGHWAWWVRIEGQFINIPPDKRGECDEAVREAIATLQTPEGIPYTVHLLHVRLRRS